MYTKWLKSLQVIPPICDPLTIEPLYQGVANQAFLVACGGAKSQRQWVLKKFRHDHPYGMDRAQEVATQTALARQQLAPEVHAFDDVRGFLLQEYLTAPSLDKAPFSDADSGNRTRVLAQTLARIHTVQVDAIVWSLRERVDNYLKALATFDKAASKSFQNKLKAFKSLFSAWGAHPVFCHNDLAMHHIFLTQPVRVIDWEYSGYGERLFDIASAVLTNRLNTSQTRSLLNAYEGVSGVTLDREQFSEWLKLVKVINELWFELCHQLQKQYETATSTDGAIQR